MVVAVRSSLLRRTWASPLAQQTLFPISAPIISSFLYRASIHSSSRPSSVQRSIIQQIPVAGFHISAKRALLPALPQRIDGTANDAAVAPEPSPSHGSYHWTFERLVSAALIPLTVAPFAAGSLNPVMDAVLCGTILIHSHIGFQAVIIDYLPNKRVPKTRSLFEWGLRLATLSVGVGLYEFETNDVGVTEAIKKIWTA